jgi:hypothetical protein
MNATPTCDPCAALGSDHGELKTTTPSQRRKPGMNDKRFDVMIAEILRELRSGRA